MGVAGFRTAAERTSADGGPAACSFVHLHATSRKPMRQLLKNTFTLALALVFTAGMAFGQDNTATTDQSGPSNFSDIVQEDEDNLVNLEQVNNGNAANGNEATVLQRFNNNEAQINQLGEGTLSGNPTFSSADVVQRGNNNFLDLDQSAFFGFHTADIDQLGNNNRVLLKSSNGGGEANVYFDGNRNELVKGESDGTITKGEQARQTNPGNLIDVEVDGDGNKIGADQQDTSPNGAELTVDITGSRNFVPTFQGNRTNTASGSMIDIDVANGSDNFLRATQVGPDHEATIDLNGMSDDNQVVIQQSMSGNTATVTVDGMDNISTVCQNSTCN
jgi:hypothetical protein